MPTLMDIIQAIQNPQSSSLTDQYSDIYPQTIRQPKVQPPPQASLLELLLGAGQTKPSNVSFGSATPTPTLTPKSTPTVTNQLPGQGLTATPTVPTPPVQTLDQNPMSAMLAPQTGSGIIPTATPSTTPNPQQQLQQLIMQMLQQSQAPQGAQNQASQNYSGNLPQQRQPQNPLIGFLQNAIRAYGERRLSPEQGATLNERRREFDTQQGNEQQRLQLERQQQNRIASNEGDTGRHNKMMEMIDMYGKLSTQSSNEEKWKEYSGRTDAQFKEVMAKIDAGKSGNDDKVDANARSYAESVVKKWMGERDKAETIVNSTDPSVTQEDKLAASKEINKYNKMIRETNKRLGADKYLSDTPEQSSGGQTVYKGPSGITIEKN